MKTVLDNYGFDTEIITASVRNITHVEEAAIAGADIATIQVLYSKWAHPLTDKGIAQFLEDWKQFRKD